MITNVSQPDLGYRFIERVLSQPYDHWEENHPDEYQFVIESATSLGDPTSERELLYCAVTQFADDKTFEDYAAAVKRYKETYAWIPTTRKSRHHRDGIYHNQQTAAHQGYGWMSGQLDPVVYLVPSGPQPFWVIPQNVDWLRTQKVLSEEVMRFLKAKPGKMRNLKPHVFEQFVLELLAGLGYQVEWVGRRTDISGDGIVIGCLPCGLKVPMLLEAKCYAEANLVGIEYADRLYGAMKRQGYLGAILATTSSFTKNVWTKYGNIWRFYLRDFEALAEWLSSYEPQTPLHLHQTTYSMPSALTNVLL